jgi:hypothetical protein
MMMVMVMVLVLVSLRGLLLPSFLSLRLVRTVLPWWTHVCIRQYRSL